MSNLPRRRPLHIWIPTNKRYANHKPAPMDGLNELINGNRSNRNEGARRERENVEHCAWFIKQAMAKQRYRPMTYTDRCRAMVYMTIVEPHGRRDVSNVIGGVSKYALDALTARNERGVGAIWDDNTTWLKKFSPTIRIDPENPGIEITVIPVEEAEVEA